MDKLAYTEQDKNQSEKIWPAAMRRYGVGIVRTSLIAWTVFNEAAYKRPPAAVSAAGA